MQTEGNISARDLTGPSCNTSVEAFNSSIAALPAWVKEQGLSMTREHQEIGLITACGPAPRLSRTPVQPGRPAPKPGSDALEILQSVGMGDQFDDLVQRGIVRIDGVAAG